MNKTVPVFPFTALCDQPDLQKVLLLLAVDPRIGGVLLSGPRGMAKTTSARALAEVMPEGSFVNLPLGADEEQLSGSLDIDSVLQEKRLAFKPGLLAKADGGVLYIDEVNLLADSLVDLLLDVSSSGVNRVERDGISHTHSARIALIGSMNPEEGQLRPQLLDRFGLYLQMPETLSVQTRQTIVRQRLAFDADPQGFVAAHAQALQMLRRELQAARERLEQIAFSDENHEQVARLCFEGGVEGVRADLVLLRAARAHAALNQRSVILSQDISAVAGWALAHRRQDNPSTAQAPTSAPPSGTGANSAADSAPGEGAAHGQTRNADGADWGSLPSQPVAPAALKSVRPLQAKKP
ncbi:AAA family ATPase [Granulosicoccaceae sp. 1_MG-2023]|nr:AAA family ATPase [Granulosicoccaceae sp. 1_MG-2023]